MGLKALRKSEEEWTWRLQVDMIIQHLDQTQNTSTYYAPLFAIKIKYGHPYSIFSDIDMSITWSKYWVYFRQVSRDYTFIFSIISFRYIDSTSGSRIWWFRSCILCYYSNRLLYSLRRSHSRSIGGYIDFGWPFLCLWTDNWCIWLRWSIFLGNKNSWFCICKVLVLVEMLFSLHNNLSFNNYLSPIIQRVIGFFFNMLNVFCRWDNLVDIWRIKHMRRFCIQNGISKIF